MSAGAQAPTGECKDIIVAAKHFDAGTGGLTYEVPMPWTRLAPFTPSDGGDPGLHLALNEDDGAGRHGFMACFGDVQTKSLDSMGDLILGK